MMRKYKDFFYCILLALAFLAFPLSGFAEVTSGWLVDINAEESKITIDEALGYPEKKYVTYAILENTKWHICTLKACILKVGAEGFSAFKESVKKEAYGRPYRSFRVLIDATDGNVSALELQIITKIH